MQLGRCDDIGLGDKTRVNHQRPKTVNVFIKDMVVFIRFRMLNPLS